MLVGKMPCLESIEYYGERYLAPGLAAYICSCIKTPNFSLSLSGWWPKGYKTGATAVDLRRGGGAEKNSGATGAGK